MDSVDSDKALQEKDAELRRMQEMLDQMQRQITLQKQQGQAWFDYIFNLFSIYFAVTMSNRSVNNIDRNQNGVGNVQYIIRVLYIFWFQRN